MNGYQSLINRTRWAVLFLRIFLPLITLFLECVIVSGATRNEKKKILIFF